MSMGPPLPFPPGLAPLSGSRDGGCRGVNPSGVGVSQLRWGGRHRFGRRWCGGDGVLPFHLCCRPALVLPALGVHIDAGEGGQFARSTGEREKRQSSLAAAGGAGGGDEEAVGVRAY